jgi:hypothetical protein
VHKLCGPHLAAQIETETENYWNFFFFCPCSVWILFCVAAQIALLCFVTETELCFVIETELCFVTKTELVYVAAQIALLCFLTVTELCFVTGQSSAS